MASHVQDTSQAYRLYITVCTLLVVIVLTTTLRVWSRLRYFRMLTVDDGLIVLGTVRLLLPDSSSLNPFVFFSENHDTSIDSSVQSV